MEADAAATNRPNPFLPPANHLIIHRSNLMMPKPSRQRTGRLAVVATICALAGVGCGGSSTVDPDTTAVVAQLAGLGDLAGMPDRFGELFVAGKVPDDPAAYGEFGYEAAGPVEISGDTATVPVRIFGGVLSPAEGDKAKKQSKATEGTATWTFQRVGDEWKIVDAPLTGA